CARRGLFRGSRAMDYW
nr:immunoglobulin heavy chain junction region [Mus musculus]